MKRLFYLFITFSFFGCVVDEEPSPRANSGDVDARLNFYWDRYEEYNGSTTDSAFFYMQEVKSLAEVSGKQDWLASAYWALGDIQKDQGKSSEAVYHYLYAAKVFQEVGKLSRMADAYNSIGYIYMKARSYETALSYFQKVKNVYLYKGNSNDKAMVAHNLGICYREMGREAEAEEVLVSGLQEATDKMLISKLHNTLGILNFQQGTYGKAREHYHLSIQFTEQGMDSIRIVAGAYNNIGESYLLEGDYESAEEWLKKSLLVKEGIGDPVFVQAVLNTFGKLKIEQGHNAEAVQLMEEGLQSIDPNVVDDAVGESLSLINEALVKSGRAAGSAEKMARLNDQLASYSQRLVRYNQQLIALQDKLDVAGKQQGLALSADRFEQDQQLGMMKEEKEQVQLAAMLIPILILLLAALVFYWFIRRQRRSKAVMGAIEEVLRKSAMRHNKN